MLVAKQRWGSSVNVKGNSWQFLQEKDSEINSYYTNKRKKSMSVLLDIS